MIYRGDAPHPAHQGFAEAVDADLLSLDQISIPIDYVQQSILEEMINGVMLPNYDIYIAEGTRALYGALTNQILRKSILIYLAGDQALYKLMDESYDLDDSVNRVISNYGMSILKKLFNEYIDGVIAVSDFSAEYTSHVLPEKPMRVAHPYIQPELFGELGEISPELERNVAITVGAFDSYKGQDLLVKAWETVRSHHPEARLLLVGSGYPERFRNVSGVRLLGYVDDLPEAISRASLYVQPSRVDNFPVSVLEAMRAGLPAVVTNTTGSKSEVMHLGSDFIAEPTAQSLAKSVSRYFSLPLSDRNLLSKTAREIGSGFDAISRKKSFRSQFEALLNEV